MPRPAALRDTDVRIDKLIVGPFENNVFVVRCTSTGERHHRRRQRARAAARGEQGDGRPPRAHHPRPLGPHPGGRRALRDAGIDVGIADADASMLPELRLRDPRRRGGRGRRPPAPHHPQPRPHRRARRRSCSRATRSCSAATPCSPAARATRRFPGGDFEQIIESIDRRLFTLPADLLVLPGHGLDTTIGTERPHLQEWVDRGW